MLDNLVISAGFDRLSQRQPIHKCKRDCAGLVDLPIRCSVLPSHQTAGVVLRPNVSSPVQLGVNVPILAVDAHEGAE